MYMYLVYSALFQNSFLLFVTFSFVLELRGPQSKVVSDELHNSGRVLVLFLVQMLDVSNSVVESLLGKVAGLGGLVHDFVVEDREVKGKTKSNGVGGLKVLGGNIRGLLVGIEGTVSNTLVSITGSVFGDVSEVITLHLEEENLGFGVLGTFDKDLVQKLENISAEIFEFFFDLLLKLLKERKVLAALGFFLLFNGADGSPGGSARSDGVLVGDGEKVSFFDGEFLLKVDNLFHVVEHILESFGLLGELGHVDEFVFGEGHDVV